MDLIQDVFISQLTTSAQLRLFMKALSLQHTFGLQTIERRIILNISQLAALLCI